MKVLVLLSRVPYPLEKGDKLRAYHQIKRLSEKHDIILCCLNDKKLHPEAIRHLAPYCLELKIIRLSKLKIYLNLLLGLFSNRPLQVNYFYSRSAQKQIDHLVERHLPKHIYCQLVRVTEYVYKYTIIPKTLDYMDALSKGVARRIPAAAPWWKPILKLEAKRLANYERAMFDRFEHKTIISEQDRQLIDHDQRDTIKVVRNGVDESFFAPMPQEKTHDLVFTGNMSYPPNIDSANYLVKEIMPLVWKQHPKANLLISGARPVSAVKALQSERVQVTGWVEDIRTSYARSRIFVAPMQIGTGLQNKLLEAMAMQLPCITSQLANNALGATPGKHILIGEQPQDYARLILQLLQDVELYKLLAKNGHDFVKQNYNWSTTTALLEEGFEADS